MPLVCHTFVNSLIAIIDLFVNRRVRRKRSREDLLSSSSGGSRKKKEKEKPINKDFRKSALNRSDSSGRDKVIKDGLPCKYI